MYQSVASLTIPLGKTPRQFFDGRIPNPQAKRSSKLPPPGPIKRANTPPPGAFFSIIDYKNMKKSDRNHVKLQDFIIFR